MYNCIFDDNSVMPMDTGPCPEFNSAGAAFVDAYNEETIVDVFTEPPIDAAGFGFSGLGLIGAVLFAASFLKKGR